MSMYVWCLKMPKEVIGSSSAGVTGSCAGLQEELQTHFTTEPLLQPQGLSYIIKCVTSYSDGI